MNGAMTPLCPVCGREVYDVTYHTEEEAYKGDETHERFRVRMERERMEGE